MSSGVSSFLTSNTLKIAVTFWPRSSSFGASSLSCVSSRRVSPARTPDIDSSNFSIFASRKLNAGRRRITSSSALANSVSPWRKVKLVLM